MTVSTNINMFSVPLLSSFSARVRRHPVIILSTISSTLGSVVHTLCCTISAVFPLPWLYLSASFGAAGENISLVSIIYTSYITHTVEEKYRAAGVFAVMDAILFASIGLGPIHGSIILNYTNHKVILLFGISIFSCLLLMVFIWIAPESRTKKSRRQSVGEHLASKQAFSARQLHRRASSSDPFDETSSIFSKKILTEKLHELGNFLNILEPIKILSFSEILEKRARHHVYFLVPAQGIIGNIIEFAFPFVLLYAKTRFL